MIFGERDRGDSGWSEHLSMGFPLYHKGDGLEEYLEKLKSFYSRRYQHPLIDASRSGIEIGYMMKILDGQIVVSEEAKQAATRNMAVVSGEQTADRPVRQFLLHPDYYNNIIGAVNVAAYNSHLAAARANEQFLSELRLVVSGQGPQGCNPAVIAFNMTNRIFLGSLPNRTKQFLINEMVQRHIETHGIPDEIASLEQAEMAFNRMRRLNAHPISLSEYLSSVQGQLGGGLADAGISPRVLDELEEAVTDYKPKRSIKGVKRD